MPSTIVHMAFAGLIAAALLGEAYDRKSVLFIMGVIVFIDLDVVFDLVAPVGHRTVFHNLWIPFAAGVLVLYDVHVREESFLLRQWGYWGYRVAWVTVLCYAVAGVLLDLTNGVVNLFWPVHDQFYTLSGEVELSDQRGIVQTFLETEEGNGASAPTAVGTTEDIQITTGVAPGEPDAPGEDPERVFPVIGATWELIVLVTGALVTVGRFYVDDLLVGTDDE